MRGITPSTEYNGFYEIPEYSRYLINEEGVVINHLSGGFLYGGKNPAGYVNLRLLGDDGNTLTWGRHRLLCYVFKYRSDYKRLLVNHIDGIKGRDVLDNLEWTTPVGNVEHAGKIGITPKCIPVQVRDVDTGVIIEYPSATVCARENGLSKDAILYRLKVGEERIFPERKQYRKACVDTPWIVSPHIELDLLKNSTSKSVTVRSLLSGTTHTFDKIEEAARCINVHPAILGQWLKREGQPVFKGLIQVKWGHDPRPFREVDDIYLECEKTTGQRFVVSIHNDTDKKMLYNTSVDCAKARGLNKTTLHWRLKSKGEHAFPDGYRYAYYSDIKHLFSPTD